MAIRSYQGTSFSLIPLDAEGDENIEFPALFVSGDLLNPNDLKRLSVAIKKAEDLSVDLDFSRANFQ